MSNHRPVAVYDEIGRHYARYRQPDPRIASQILDAIGGARSVVNVGAGTGSYEPVDRRVVAVEPSAVMISQRVQGAATVIQASAEQLPFASRAFDAATAFLTIHHWSAIQAGLDEMVRVATRVVVLTFDPDVHSSFWLFRDYVPEAINLPSGQPPRISDVAEMIAATRITTVPIPWDCKDGLGWAYWRRPHAYLDPGVRACISSLAALPDELVARRLERLESELADGTWAQKYGDLLDGDEIDGGFRLVVRDPS